jgi:hypothetical protein
MSPIKGGSMTPETAAWISRGVATCVVAGLIYGIARRRRPEIHMPVMTTCFIVDVLVVVFIEVTRWLRGDEMAVTKATGEASTMAFSILNVHVAASVTMLVNYALAIWSGRRLHRTGVGRSFHRANAAVFIVVRTVNYVTSFMI